MAYVSLGRGQCLPQRAQSLSERNMNLNKVDNEGKGTWKNVPFHYSWDAFCSSAFMHHRVGTLIGIQLIMWGFLNLLTGRGNDILNEKRENYY